MDTATTRSWTRRENAPDRKLRWVYTATKGSETDDEADVSSSPPLAFVSQLTLTLRFPDGRLVFRHVREADARVASRGYVMTNETVGTTQQISALPFAQKLAWFRDQTEKLLEPVAQVGFLKMRLHRENVLVESMEQLLGVRREHMHWPLTIECIDEGKATTNEWLVLMAEQLFAETIGLFMHPRGDPSSWTINPNSLEATGEHCLYFRATGRVLGRALLDGLPTKTHLAMPLLKHLLGQPIALEDVKMFDPETHEMLTKIRDGEEVARMGLSFCIMTTRVADGDEEIRVVDLKENGSEIPVAEANKDEYIELRMQFEILDAFAEQLHHLMVGLFEVVPQEMLLPFSAEELDRVLFDPTRLGEESNSQAKEAREQL
jgi:hypothetical protein